MLPIQGIAAKILHKHIFRIQIVFYDLHITRIIFYIMALNPPRDVKLNNLRDHAKEANSICFVKRIQNVFHQKMFLSFVQTFICAHVLNKLLRPNGKRSKHKKLLAHCVIYIPITYWQCEMKNTRKNRENYLHMISLLLRLR